MKVEIECPYCYKIHVHTISIPEVDTPKGERVLPHDEETMDLEELKEEKK